MEGAQTRRNSARTHGRPQDIAPTAVLLASSDGDFYVGQTLSPNGGDVFL